MSDSKKDKGLQHATSMKFVIVLGHIVSHMIVTECEHVSVCTLLRLSHCLYTGSRGRF